MNILASAAFLLSLLATNISPEDSWMIAACGLLFPILVVLNFIFVIGWLIAKSYWVLPSASLMIMAIPTLIHAVQFDFSDAENEKGVKIMSFNSRLLDYYEAIAKQGVVRDSIFQMLDREQPDIVCFQEFYSRESKKWDIITPLISRKTKYHYLNEMGDFYNDTRWGLFTISAYPIVNKKSFYFDPAYPFATYCDIKINKDTVRVFNVHLRSFRFSNKDREVLGEMLENNEIPSSEDSKGILKRMEIAYESKAKEIDTISKVIKSSPHRVIVCGDLNDPPSSYAYHEFTEKLDDAFVESGEGYGKTYAGKLPLLRIDYILPDERIRTFNYKTLDHNLSDHYPVSCEMELGN
ncbi:MAG: endonuclease/exonuclease/phosphatase family protein [Bacteroidetes bacterium]|nr:endonuclease/exonuclease/phosphatase family protein [Bacteroidota bacterium]